MSHPIADLLKRAMLVGATEVRLVPGRRTIVVLAQGESEVVERQLAVAGAIETAL